MCVHIYVCEKEKQKKCSQVYKIYLNLRYVFGPASVWQHVKCVRIYDFFINEKIAPCTCNSNTLRKRRNIFLL